METIKQGLGCRDHVLNQFLTQGIKRDFIGNYSCSAINDIGQGFSNTLSLDIKCKNIAKYRSSNMQTIFLLLSVSPACAPGQQFVYEVAKLSTVLVSCNMEANPDTGLAFRWTFNTTANTISIPVSAEF